MKRIALAIVTLMLALVAGRSASLPLVLPVGGLASATVLKGNTQEIFLKSFEGDGKDIVAAVTESKGGQSLRRESTNK